MVFERRPGRATLVAFAAIFAAGCAAPLVADPLGELARGHAPSFTDAAIVGELVEVTLYLAPVLVAVLILARASRRYSRAIVARDHVVIEPFAVTRHGAAVIALPEIVGRKDTPHGLLLDAPASFDRFTCFFFPPLIPTRDPDELARVHALLDAPAIEAPADVPTAAGGKGLAPRDLLGAAVALGLAAGGALVLNDVGGPPSLAGGWVLFAAGVLVVIALLPRRSRVHLGASWVSVGPMHVPWSAVREIACDGPAFYLEVADGRRRVGRPGREEIGPLFEVARARLPAGAVVDGTPPWARRRRRALHVAIALLTLAGLWLGPARALTLEGCVGVDDHHGYRARVVYRGFDQAPVLVVIVEPQHVPLRVRAGGWRSLAFVEPGVDVEHRVDVDLRAGRLLALGEEHDVPPDATVVHVRRDGVRWSTRPLSPFTSGALGPPPAEVVTVNAGLELLAAWADPNDPLVRDILDGRTARRCLDLRSARLLLQTDEGVVTTLIVLDAGATLAAGSGCSICALAARHAGRLVRLTATGQALEADLPTYEQALAAYHQVCDGRPVEQATAAFAAELWSRPVTAGR